MEVSNKYQVSKDTAALISCLEELSTAHENIYNALALHWSEEQVEGCVGEKIFNKLFEVRDEIFKVIQSEIEENLSYRDEIKAI